MGHCLVLAVLVLGLVAAATRGQDLPQGWRLPTPAELSYDERKDSTTRHARATADFNRDGVADGAFLLKSRRFSGEAVWVRLSTAGEGFIWVKLAEIKWGPKYPTVDLAMGLDAMPPGVYPYGCFDGARDCNFGETHQRPKLKLRDPSIHYFKFGSASSAFFWSHKHGRFLRVWLSD